MSKPKHERALADHEAQAILSNVRTSPRKLNLVAAMIRNMHVQRAIATLTFSKRRIAHQVRKTLESAIANAENNHQLDVDRLIVTRAEVGRSIVMRRFHARGRGRSARVEKWFSHMKIVVAERPDEIEADDDLDADTIEGTAIPVSGAETNDHMHTAAQGALPATVDDEAEAAEQTMSADAVAALGAPRVGEHAVMSEQTPVDHAHTEAQGALPASVDDEAEAAEQSLSSQSLTGGQQTPGNTGQGAS